MNYYYRDLNGSQSCEFHDLTYNFSLRNGFDYVSKNRVCGTIFHEIEFPQKQTSGNQKAQMQCLNAWLNSLIRGEELLEESEFYQRYFRYLQEGFLVLCKAGGDLKGSTQVTLRCKVRNL